MSSSSPKQDFDHEELYDDDDEPYTDEEEANLDNTKSQATGEVCVEKPLSVKEQIKNFANLKIQELLGPQAVSSADAQYQEQPQESYQEEEDYHDPEEQEEYEYSVASDSEQYSHQNESCPSPSPHLEEPAHQQYLEEPITPVSKTTPVEAISQLEKATVLPIERPPEQQIQKSLSPCPLVPAPTKAPYRQPVPVPEFIPVQANQPYRREDHQFAQPATAKMEHVPSGTQPHQVQQYRPPEPSFDPYMRAPGRGKGGWVSGHGGAVQLTSAGRGATQQPQIFLGYEVVSEQNAGSVNIGLRRLMSDRQWGFTLYGGVDAGCPPFVNHVSLNSPAYQMGLEIGDVILAICGVPAEGKNLYSLKAEILRAGNELDFVILKQGIDLAKLIQRAPQVVPQLIRGGQQKAGLQRSHSGRNKGYNTFARNSNGSFEEPDYGGVVSGQGIRPVQTRSLRILEEQLAKGVNPGSAVQSKQHHA
ncbi:Synaptopodin 2-like, partial [Cichlidogyrus casuarinus]